MPNRQLFVTTDTALNGGTAGYTDPSLVASGAFAVLNSENASAGSLNLGGTSASDKLTLVRGGANPQIEHINKADIKKVLTQAYRAEVVQKTAVGYAGSGSAALSNDAGVASIKVIRVEAGYEPFPRVTASTKVSSGDLPYAVASRLAQEFNSQASDRVFGTSVRSFVTADILSNEASTQLVDDDGTPANVTLTVTNGSIIAVATVTANADIDGLAAGSQIRIGHATATTYPVYVASAVATNAGSGATTVNITLDRPYAGASATGVAVGDINAGAPASDDTVGVIITANASVDGEPAISFRTAVDGTLESDTVTSVATPQTGAGLNAQIANLEKFSWGSRSYTQTNYFPQTPTSNVASGVDYDILTLLVENNNDHDVISQNKYREIHIAYPQGNITLSTLAAFFNS